MEVIAKKKLPANTKEQNNRINITRIQHIGIPSNNLKVSIDFYERLGFKQTMQSDFWHNGVSGEVVMMKSGEVIIELYHLAKQQRFCGSIDHIAFDVHDIDAVFHCLKSRGFTILEKAPTSLPFWKKGCVFFNVMGPDCERLEFNEIL